MDDDEVGKVELAETLRAEKIDQEVTAQSRIDRSSEYLVEVKADAEAGYVPPAARFDAIGEADPGIGVLLGGVGYPKGMRTPTWVAQRARKPLAEIMARLPAEPELDSGHWNCAVAGCHNQTLGNKHCVFHRKLAAGLIGDAKEYRVMAGARTIDKSTPFYVGVSGSRDKGYGLDVAA